ncbi:TetR/AcrR family transcriptional regulator [Salipaludibacillus daqingensis]|uniref:TetR/AcrR family transcriptional regulator n=1 Tax=Salipaludibacillus daqingensis TaxID=3041001 RepID=UPI0024772B9E|nr:TetR/AcrR family transcriptional regulator [Salipaludibacillus daqingensis]
MDETKEKILNAAIDIMHLKGYSSATVREIAAEAGVSEMTLFRKFSNKQELLNGIIKKYSFAFSMKKIFTEELTYDLKTDLANVSKTYQTFMEKNKKIVLLAYKECNIHDEISEGLTENPKLVKTYLCNYLAEMVKKGKVAKDINIELQVMNFLWMNLGYFSSQFISGKKVAAVPVDDFIKSSVITFAKGLQ